MLVRVGGSREFEPSASEGRWAEQELGFGKAEERSISGEERVPRIRWSDIGRAPAVAGPFCGVEGAAGERGFDDPDGGREFCDPAVSRQKMVLLGLSPRSERRHDQSTVFANFPPEFHALGGVIQIEPGCDYRDGGIPQSKAASWAILSIPSAKPERMHRTEWGCCESEWTTE